MTRARPKPTIAVVAFCTAAFALAAFAPAQAVAGKPAKRAKAPPPPNADQQEVVAAIIADTFPRPKREPLMLSLCLDVEIAPAVDEDAPPPPAPHRRGLKRAVAVEPPPPQIIHGAPADLVTRLARPWRVVASALSCRLDPRQPIALGDAGHTPAQLVTVHLVPDVAAGTIKIDWTEGPDSAAASSRDCTATRGPRGWTVRCGGTWFQ